MNYFSQPCYVQHLRCGVKNSELFGYLKTNHYLCTQQTDYSLKYDKV